jgi:hypothetical protein
MRMLVSVEFADAGMKSGTHRVPIIGRDTERPESGDIGLSLEEAKTLISAIESAWSSAPCAHITTLVHLRTIDWASLHPRGRSFAC